MSRRAFRVPPRIYARLAAYFILCWTVIAVLMTAVVPYAVAIVLALALYTTFPLVLFLRFGGFPFYPGAWFRLLVARPFWYTQLMLPLAAGLEAIGLVIGAPFGYALSTGRVLAASFIAAMSILYIVGYFGARRLAIHELDASLSSLPAAFDGVTIAQISDLHVGPHTSRRYLRRVERAVRSVAPDIIAVTGDLVDDRPEDVAHYAAVFGRLAAPLGVFVIAGNHEVYAGWDDIERELRSRNVGSLLVNEAYIIERDGACVTIVGTGDPAGKQMNAARVAPDIARTLAGIPSDGTVIALAHNPALWPALAERGVALTLSGHTHWGQLSFPRHNWSLASPFLEYAMGIHQRGNALLYIAPGTGYWGIPFRLGAPSEVTLVTLRRGPAELRDRGRRTVPRMTASVR